MDKLAELQRRKAELKAQMGQQHSELKKTLLEIREEVEPGNLLKKAVRGALGFSKNKQAKPGMLSRLPEPIAFLVDVLVRDPKWALGLKLLAPVALRYWPKSGKAEPSEGTPGTSAKTNLYGQLRRGIAALRGQLRKPKIVPENMTRQPEN